MALRLRMEFPADIRGADGEVPVASELREAAKEAVFAREEAACAGIRRFHEGWSEVAQGLAATAKFGLEAVLVAAGGAGGEGPAAAARVRSAGARLTAAEIFALVSEELKLGEAAAARYREPDDVMEVRAELPGGAPLVLLISGPLAAPWIDGDTGEEHWAELGQAGPH